MRDTQQTTWLGLMIGNSRLHWAHFIGETLTHTWDTEYLPADVVYQLSQSQTLKDLPPEIFPTNEATGKKSPHSQPTARWSLRGRYAYVLRTLSANGTTSPDRRSRAAGIGGAAQTSIANANTPSSPRQSPQRGEPPHGAGSSSPPLLLASVVPSQTALWQTYPNVRILTLDQVPIKGIYPTLGIDRALALWGAGQNWGFPMLVIDAGTALTFTGADANQHLVGGAILPGLGLQLATLAEKTGQLPTVERPRQLPDRYALNTQEAMQSGVIYTLVAGIKDFIEAWWRDFPQGNIAMTGGDRTLLVNYLRSKFPEIADSLNVEANLIFWGMQKCNERCCFHPR